MLSGSHTSRRVASGLPRISCRAGHHEPGARVTTPMVGNLHSQNNSRRYTRVVAGVRRSTPRVASPDEPRFRHLTQCARARPATGSPFKNVNVRALTRVGKRMRC